MRIAIESELNGPNIIPPAETRKAGLSTTKYGERSSDLLETTWFTLPAYSYRIYSTMTLDVRAMTTQPSGPKNDLTSGQTAGIVVAIIALPAMLGAAAWILFRKRRPSRGAAS